MDSGRFDTLTRNFGQNETKKSRRGVLKSLVGGALATTLAVFAEPEAAEARRKKKKKKRCTKPNRGCKGHRSCCSKNCCFRNRGRGKFCAPKSARCCSRQLGGGACRNNGRCCGPKPSFPGGSCCPRTMPNCCPGDFEACCGPGLPACFPPSEMIPLGWCCPAGRVPCQLADDEIGCCAPGALSAQAVAGAAPTPQSTSSASSDE